MKKLLVSIFIGIATCQLAFAQNLVPNAGFETWDYYNTWTLEPEFWTTSNGQIIESVIPDSSAFAGELAMRVTVLPGFEGGVPQAASIVFPIDYNPEMISFAVKTNIAGDTDMDEVYVSILFFVEEVQIGDSLIWISDSSIPGWELIELPIPDLPMEADECKITVTAGRTNGLFGGSWENWISVDEFEFSGSQSIITNNCNSVIYPNPTQGKSIQISDCGQAFSGLVNLYDLQGQLVWNEYVNSGHFNANLSPSLYILSFESKTGIPVKTPLLIIE